METVFTGIYLFEAVSKILVQGWKRYLDSAKNVFDFWITVMAVSSSVIVYYPNEFSDSRLIRMILTARVLRLIRLLSALKSFQLIGRISAEILPAASSVITVLFLSMYFFAALGMQLYGGMITRDPSNPMSELQLGSEYADSSYWANSFNDMLSGMNVRTLRPHRDETSELKYSNVIRFYLIYWLLTIGLLPSWDTKLRHKASGSASSSWPSMYLELFLSTTS